MTETPRRLAHDEIEAVAQLARRIWQATYPALITQAQIDFMLADRYAASRIRQQLDDPRHAWWVTGMAGTPSGFAHALLGDHHDCKLDKLYVYPGLQRRGLGRSMLEAVRVWAHHHHARCVRLQVNRGNVGALKAYEHYGFHIIESRVFDIGQGFVMDDHVMEMPL